MNILLVAINAKYIHSSLAAYSLYAYLGDEEKQHVQIQEFTVNQPEEFIVSELFRAKPDVLAFSCYIWNIGMVMSLVETFKKVMPHVQIIAGGPEASYEYDGLLSQGVGIVVRGEGEEPFKQLVQSFMSGTNATQFHVITAPEAPIPLESIPFVYEHGFNALQNRIIYYETSRGCVNRCGYCLSSATEGVRFLPWERIKSDLDKFVTGRVKQVKFVDRTFNCSKHHAMAIWEYLIQNDNCTINFHFEIAGELLDCEMLTLLATARKGLFQFEIGVQSTNPKTLECIRRATDTARLFENVRKLKIPGNIRLHLDLIVGLPYEDYGSFRQSFNDVFACCPHKLQVGFLKLLKGSRLRIDAAKYGIVYKNAAPYNVLKTDFISFEEINRIRKIEHMVETFYCASGFYGTVRFMLANYSTPFDLFDTMAAYWEDTNHHLVSHRKAAMYSFLHSFGQKFLPEKIHEIRELLKFDMLLQENVRTFPSWINDYYTPDNMKITRTTAVHSFDYDICGWLREIDNCPNSIPFLVGVITSHPQKYEIHFDYSLSPDERAYTKGDCHATTHGSFSHCK